MAADVIRVRLHFDYAPPAAVGCRQCWMLVDRGSCRVVADLESLIRERFELSRRSIVSLFIQDCYLPHTESVQLVRDNDCVRVKVDTVCKSTTQNSPPAAAANRLKRPAEDDAPPLKKKKRKRAADEPLNAEKTQPSPQKNGKRKKTEEKKPKTSPNAAPKPSPSLKKLNKNKPKPPSSSSSSTSSSSSEEEQPAKKAASVIKPDTTKTKNIPKKPTRPTSSSSSSSSCDSSSEEEPKQNVAQTPRVAPASNGTKSSNEEEIELVIKKPVQHPHGRILLGRAEQEATGGGTGKQQEATGTERGRGRQQQQEENREPWRTGRGRGKQQEATGRGRGRGKKQQQEENREPWRTGRGRGSCVEFDYSEDRGEKEPSYSTDKLTTVSTVLQNGVKEPEPKPDYSSLPLLAAPPQVGQSIAFKLLELTENYTPEVSEYKEAKIIDFDPASKQIELELRTSFQAPAEPGKFDLVYQNPDGSERVEYAVDRGTLVTERWDSLLEPRLIL